MTERIEILVEEPSMEAALRLLVPKIIGELDFEVFPHSGKSDLKNKLASRLRGYAKIREANPWFRDHCRVIILLDRDNEDCRELKRELEAMASQASLLTRSVDAAAYALATRIAIEELEAWFFGNWNAVRQAFPNVPCSIPQRAGYRNPDGIEGGTWEAMQRILSRAGHVWPGKISLARSVAAAMEPERNTSPSFGCFRALLEEMKRS